MDNKLEMQSKAEVLLSYHKKTFKLLKEEKPYYKPTLFYPAKINKVKTLAVNFWDNEMDHEGFLYVEQTTKDRDLINTKERILYRWKPNPRNECHKESSKDKQSVYYVIPVEELEVVSINGVLLDTNLIPKSNPIRTKKVESTSFNQGFDDDEDDDNGLPDPDLDLPMDQMTTRDYAAIQLRVPDSHKPWLNEMIKKANK